MNKPRILSVSVAALLTLPSFVQAVDRNWIGTDDNWNTPSNWDTGVPTSGTGDNIFIHTLNSLVAPPITANNISIGVGSPTDPSTAFLFDAGTFTFNYIGVAEAFNGLNPGNNRFGRAIIAPGTTINVNDFFVGEQSGGTGQVVQVGGDVNVARQLRVGHWPQADVGAGVASIYTLNDGTITVAGDPIDPFNEGEAGNVFLGIDSTGVLIINGGTFTSKGITLDNRAATAGEDTLAINGGTVNIGANGIVSQNAANPGTYEVTLSGGTLRATASWTSNLETTLASGGAGITYDTNGNNITLTGVLKGDGGLAKTGGGELVLTAANSYSGSTTINQGTLRIGAGGNTGSVGTGPVVVNAAGTLVHSRTGTSTISGPISGSGGILVQSGTLELANANGTVGASIAAGGTLAATGTLGPVAVDPGGTLQAGASGAGNLTVSDLSLSGSTLRFTVGAATTQLNVTNAGGFVANGAAGSNTILINPMNLTAGIYTLVDYAGVLGGAGFGTFQLAGLPTRATGSLVNNVAGTSIDLDIASIDFPKWTGAIDANWDGSTQNWELVNAGTPTNYQNFDAVLFDDSATGTTNINLVGVITPSAVSFNNGPTKTYTLAGAGSISGTTGLTVQGAGRVILATANNYTGPTSVQSGTLQIGDGATGSITGTNVTIANGATVELNLTSEYASPTTGQGTLSTTGANSFNLAANILSGQVQLQLAGSGTIGLNDQPTFDGGILVNNGTLRALGPQALGSTTGTTLIAPGGTLDVNALDLGAEHVLVSGTGVGGAGAIVNTGAGTIFNLHRVTLTGDASFGGTGRWDIRTGEIAGELLDLGGFRLIKVGPNQVSLVNIDATAGNIDINEGTFSIEDNSAVQGPGAITLNPSGTLGLWVNKPGRLTRQIVANGGGIAELGSANATVVDSPISLQANLTFTINNAATVYTHTGNITEVGGPRTVNVAGAGRLILMGNNTWTGGFNVNGGVLQIGNGGTTGTLGTGVSTVAATLVLARSDSTTLDGDVNPAGPAGVMILAGGGTVNLANGTDVRLNELHFGVNGQNDTIGGTLTIADGNSLLVQNALIVGNSGGGGGPVNGTINQTGGTITVNAPNTDGRNFVLGHWAQGTGIYNQSGGLLESPNISMAISWDGNGTYNLSGGTASVLGLRFGHNAGRSGVFNLTGGVLALGAEGIWEQTIGLPNDINLGGGTIVAQTNTNIFLPAELTGTNGNVTFDSNGNTLSISGALSGAGGFVKTGAGTLILTSSNSYAGPTTVNNGTLLVNSPFGSGTGASDTINVGGAGTLGGSGFIGTGAGTTNVSISGKLEPGSNGAGTLTMLLGAGTLDVSPAVNSPGSAALAFQLGTVSDKVVVGSGVLSIGVGLLEFDDFNFTLGPGFGEGDYVLFDGVSPIVGTLGANLSGPLGAGLLGTLQLADGNNDIVLHVVPEPASGVVFLAGLGAILARRRRAHV